MTERLSDEELQKIIDREVTCMEDQKMLKLALELQHYRQSERPSVEELRKIFEAGIQFSAKADIFKFKNESEYKEHFFDDVIKHLGITHLKTEQSK